MEAEKYVVVDDVFVVIDGDANYNDGGDSNRDWPQ